MMTQQEILEYNKRCAEFLGWYYENNKWLKLESLNGGVIAVLKCNSDFDLQFHSDWNLIMKVVEAIQKIRPLIISHNHCEIHMYEEGKNISINIATNSTITAVVQASNQFLIWYEQNRTV